MTIYGILNGYTDFDDCISSALFRIFVAEYSNIMLIRPNEDNNKPYKAGLEINNKNSIKFF